MRNPISRKKTASARIKFHVNFPRFFCGQGLLNFFIHAEVNKFPYIFAALRQENFSAHLSASDDGGSGLPLRRQFLSGEERILAAGVARKFLKRKKERKKDREIFPPFSLSRYLLLISSGIVDRKLINTYPRRNISSSTRLASSFFFPPPSSESLTRYTFTRQHENSTFKFSPRNKRFVTFPLRNVLLKRLLRRKEKKKKAEKFLCAIISSSYGASWLRK